jgi:hypothetical protein
MENFADSTPPANPLRGQLWYNTNTSTLCVCPADNTTTASNWITLAQSGGSGTTTFGSVTVTGNLQANNIQAVNNSNADSITTRLLTVTANASISLANVTTGNIITLNTTTITTGANATPGNIIGTWTLSGGSGGTSNAFIVTGGVINAVNGIKTDNYYYANGVDFRNNDKMYISLTNNTYKKDKLYINYLTVPLILSRTYKFKKIQDINVAGGVNIGYLLNTRNKQISEASGKKKYDGDFNFSDYKMSGVFQIGIGDVKFYGTAALTNTIDKTTSNQSFYPYTFGVRFSKF